MIKVTFLTNNGKVVSAPANSNLLRISLREQGGIPFKCGGGLCGTCKCKIEQGLEHTDAIKPKERKHLTEEQFKAGYRMSPGCRWQSAVPPPRAANPTPQRCRPPTFRRSSVT